MPVSRRHPCAQQLACQEVFETPVSELFAGLNDSVARDARGQTGRTTDTPAEKGSGDEARNPDRSEAPAGLPAYERASEVVKRLPVLTQRLPPKRNPRESEVYRMSMFAAAAAAMTLLSKVKNHPIAQHHGKEEDAPTGHRSFSYLC
jgi:hypothetical protein